VWTISPLKDSGKGGAKGVGQASTGKVVKGNQGDVPGLQL